MQLTCTGDGNCCRTCGGLGRCAVGCQGAKYKKDRHHCRLLVTISARLSQVKDCVRSVEIEGSHVDSECDWVPPSTTKLQPSIHVKDEIIHQTQSYGNTAGNIVRSLCGNKSGEDLKNTRQVPFEKTVRKMTDYNRAKHQGGGDVESLDRLVRTVLKPKGLVLHYQKGSDAFQSVLLVVSTDSVRGYARDHGELVVGLDAKFDTNRYRLPLSTMTVSAQDGHTIPIAFMISTGENQAAMLTFLTSVQQNMNCSNPHCAHTWDYEDSENKLVRLTECFREKIYQPPFVMIDKHAGSRLAVIQFGSTPILCIFHALQAHTEQLSKLHIPSELHCVLTLCFKVVLRSSSVEDANERFQLLRENIHLLGLDTHTSDSYICYLEKYWVSQSNFP